MQHLMVVQLDAVRVRMANVPCEIETAASRALKDVKPLRPIGADTCKVIRNEHTASIDVAVPHLQDTTSVRIVPVALHQIQHLRHILLLHPRSMGGPTSRTAARSIVPKIFYIQS